MYATLPLVSFRINIVLPLTCVLSEPCNRRSQRPVLSLESTSRKVRKELATTESFALLAVLCILNSFDPPFKQVLCLRWISILQKVQKQVT